MRLEILTGIFVVFGFAHSAFAAPASQTVRAAHPSHPTHLQELKTLLKIPEAQLDLAKAKLTIDRQIDSSVDIPGTLKKLDTLAENVRQRFPFDATNQTKLELLVTSLSQSGPWNDYRAFSYDLDDPFGRNIHNKLISSYLETRKGNCVSMPILLVILGQKLGLNMTLATAPEHILVKFRNDDQQWINIEATSFGTKSDASYEKEAEISPRALATGIYLRPLTKHESVVVMMGTLMEFYGQEGQQERRIAVANLALHANPNDVGAMLQKGNAYFQMLKLRYMMKYLTPAEIPLSQRRDYETLSRNNMLWFERAQALGWTQPTDTQNADYLQTVERAKARQQGGP